MPKTETTSDLAFEICKLFRVVPNGKYGKAINKALAAEYSRGYADGHEDQMRARILDAQERRNAKR